MSETRLRAPAPVSSVGVWQGLGRPLPEPGRKPLAGALSLTPPSLIRLVACKVFTALSRPQSAGP